MLNNMCMQCRKFKNGCNGTVNQTWTGCIYREADNDMMSRYQAALKKIGTLNLLNLPGEVKDILKQATNIEIKVKMLEKVAENY